MNGKREKEKGERDEMIPKILLKVNRSKMKIENNPLSPEDEMSIYNAMHHKV